MLARNWKHQQKWAIEKPKLDNARRLRGIYFIDAEDKEFKEIIKNARRKLETPMASRLILCSIQQSEAKAHSEKSMNVSDVNVTDEDDFLSRSKTIKANNKFVKERIWDTSSKMQLMSELLRLNTVCVNLFKKSVERVLHV